MKQKKQLKKKSTAGRPLKKFIVPILNEEYSVYVYVGDRLKANEEICEYIKDKADFIEPENRGRSIYRRGYHPCIWIDGTLDYRMSVATLAHESIHGVTEIMCYLGMDLNDQTGNELLAHSVAAIIRKCLWNKKLSTAQYLTKKQV